MHILLIEDNAVDAKLMQAVLSGVDSNPYCVESVTSVTEGLARLKRGPEIDIVILNSILPAAENVNGDLLAFQQITAAAPNSLVLTPGAQNEWLPRALRYIAQQAEVVDAAKKNLLEEKDLTQIALNSVGDAVIIIDLLGNLTHINHAAELLTGWSQDNALGRPLADIFQILDLTTRKIALNSALSVMQQNDDQRSTELSASFILIRSDGSECAIEKFAKPIVDRAGKMTGAVIVFHDANESRTTALKMTHLAQHDFLTGLPNRMLLTERLSQAMGLARRNHTQVGLLFIDLDFFKHINDSLGHAIGDLLLQSVAERLVSCVRATDTVCRQGGDEFVILLSEIERAQDAALTAEKLFAAFAEPHVIGIHELYVTLSIGISVYPSDGKSAEALMKNADAAMYHAKVIGRNNFQFFKMEMNARAMQRSLIESSLRRAIKLQEFVLYYQPKIDLATGVIVGVEALLRWQHPKLGLLKPAEFLAIAEECGLIVPIGGWVLRQACNQLRAWLNAGLRIIPLAINISAAELKHRYFLDGVNQVLQETGLPPYYLEMEFTESILMRDAELSVTLLESLKALGVQLAIDNFGTGYSSLSYLKRFPVDTIKIDAFFMRDLEPDSDNATIVSAMIALGRSLKQGVLAEGVETAEQFLFLRNHRCNEAQGSYFHPPVSAEDFARLLRDNNLPALGVSKKT
ncbi:MAG: EAL domain-containing protein [Pseudomonadota bacterium]